MSIQEPATWQALLGQLITIPGERARLAKALHIRPITLQRWSEGLSKPRYENIRQLIKYLPNETYPRFMRLLLLDFPEWSTEDIPPDRFFQSIPAEFYARAMSNLSLTPLSIYQQSMQDLILQQIVQHLDPDRRGLAVTLLICVSAAAGQKVRSLCEIGGLATPPWPSHPVERLRFFGAESLMGDAITHARLCVINSRQEVTFFPVQWDQHDRSMAAFPILRHARLVGGLIVSSAQEDFFTSSRLTVIEGYARLATCIFEGEPSFDPTEIELRMMPAYARQQPYFAGYYQRISRHLTQASAQGQPLSLPQARHVVWQELEEVLLQVDAHNDVESLL